MNIAALAHATYSDAQAPVMTDRSIEYQVFAKVTHRLSKATGDGFESFKDRVSALQDNRRLWNLLAADVADPSNQLSQDLRAQIFYLAEFTEKHSADILAKKGDIQVLIDINTSIMRGLRGITGTEQ